MRDLEILKIPDKQLEVFKNSCKNKYGYIDIFVHPFYSEDTTPTNNGRFVTQQYLKKRDTYISSCLENNEPIIFFQQKSDYKQLIEKLTHISKNTLIYTVKTKDGEETPVGGRRDWDKLANILHSSEVKLVKVSGLYLIKESIKQTKEEFDIKYDKEKIQIEFINNIDIYKDKFPYAREWLKEGFVPKGCVGFTIMNLLRYGIDVSIGELTAPD